MPSSEASPRDLVPCARICISELLTPVSRLLRPSLRRLLLSAAIFGVAWITLSGPPASPLVATTTRLLSWMLVMLVPGFCIHRLSARGDTRLGEALLAGIILSPVIVALLAVLALRAGLSPTITTQMLVVLAAGFGLVAALKPGGKLVVPCPRHAMIFLALVATVVLLTAFLPFTNEWWRMRSDAWFHAAVVAQIDYGGVPPEDPYFAGMALQYMWFYHVLVLVLSRVLALNSFWPMAIMNVHALVGLSLAAFYLAGALRNRFGHRFAAAATLLFGFNAAFWVFLPLKLAKAFRGEVRGWDEIRRTFSVHPFDYDQARVFMHIYYNQEFFLDKFMVATAFAFALAFMTTAWFATVCFLRERRSALLVLLAGALIGMLGFHTLVGFVMLAAVFGGAVLTLATRHRNSYRVRDFVSLVAVSLGTFVLMTPYLYEVMHLKEREQLFPLSVSFTKTAGIAISAAFVLLLAMRQRRLWTDPSPATRFFSLATLSVTLFCLLITLPGPNTYDKLGYFVFMPLAIVAGFTIADQLAALPGRRRALAAISWVSLFYLPVNGLALAACFATPAEVLVTPPEARLSRFVSVHTARDAVIIDDHNRVVMLVTAPRRYYAGSESYASQWGYPKLEMSRRLHAQRALYGRGVLDATALDALGAVSESLFVVVRPEHQAAGSTVTQRPDLFHTVYDADGLRLMRVDTRACRAAAALQNDHVSPEELIRESGL